MKIKTKYSIGDTVIYEADKGLKLAEVESFEIICDQFLYIQYKLKGRKENHFIQVELSEERILCKASKRNINKYLYKE